MAFICSSPLNNAAVPCQPTAGPLASARRCHSSGLVTFPHSRDVLIPHSFLFTLWCSPNTKPRCICLIIEFQPGKRRRSSGAFLRNNPQLTHAVPAQGTAQGTAGTPVPVPPAGQSRCLRALPPKFLLLTRTDQTSRPQQGWQSRSSSPRRADGDRSGFGRREGQRSPPRSWATALSCGWAFLG